jgi:tape measure domain-containing protein
MADGSIIIDTKLDQKNFKKDLNGMQNSVSSFAKTATKILAGIGAGLLVKKMFSATRAIEDMTAAFTPLVGGADNAKNMIEALNQTASTTPFTLDDIGKSAKQLLPILGNDVDAVTESFRMLGDTAGGNAQKLDSITRGYTKAMLKGKVDMESLNMIAEAGVPIYSELADSMGVSVKEMMKMSSQGKITSDDLTGAFQKMTGEGGIFFNGMEIASQTLSGKLSTLQDNFNQALAVLGNEFLPITKSIVDNVNKIVKSFVDWTKEGDNLNNLIKILGYSMAGLSAGFATFFLLFKGGAVIQGIITAFKTLNATIASNPFGLIAIAITTILVPAIIYLIKNWDKVVVIFESTLSQIKQGFLIAGSAIEESFVVGINKVKIAFYLLVKL